jgi:hypothetical protein
LVTFNTSGSGKIVSALPTSVREIDSSVAVAEQPSRAQYSLATHLYKDSSVVEFRRSSLSTTLKKQNPLDLLVIAHHGKRNEIYIGDLAGVEDVSLGGAAKRKEDEFVLKEGLAIKDSVSSFIESFKQKQRSTCFDDEKIFRQTCILKGPIEYLTKELFTDKDAKLMIAACFDPATTNGNGQSNTDADNAKIKKTMQLNASVLTSLFK